MSVKSVVGDKFDKSSDGANEDLIPESVHPPSGKSKQNYPVKERWAEIPLLLVRGRFFIKYSL